VNGALRLRRAGDHCLQRLSETRNPAALRANLVVNAICGVAAVSMLLVLQHPLPRPENWAHVLQLVPLMVACSASMRLPDRRGGRIVLRLVDLPLLTCLVVDGPVAAAGYLAVQTCVDVGAAGWRAWYAVINASQRLTAYSLAWLAFLAMNGPGTPRSSLSHLGALTAAVLVRALVSVALTTPGLAAYNGRSTATYLRLLLPAAAMTTAVTAGLLPTVSLSHATAPWQLPALIVALVPLYLLVQHASATERSSLLDDLTGLGNRRALQLHLRSWRRADDVAGLLVVDVDGLKRINDEFGHHAGDALLRLTAQRLQAALGPDDVVCRTGGDEFVAVVRSKVDQSGLCRLAAEVDRALTGRYDLGARSAVASASVGLASRSDGPTPHDLLVVADGRMYDAKRRRRQRGPQVARP
jgi:diguanylate cyclase (GGDEF)-like protein